MVGKDYSWEQSPHTADLAIAITASTHEGLLRASLDGFLGLLEINPEIQSDEINELYNLVLSNPTIEDVLVDFLGECIYLMEVSEHMPVGFESLTVNDGNLNAVIKCRKVRENERNEVGHIKAATYSGLEVKLVDGRFSAVLIFDT